MRIEFWIKPPRNNHLSKQFVISKSKLVEGEYFGGKFKVAYVYPARIAAGIDFQEGDDYNKKDFNFFVEYLTEVCTHETLHSLVRSSGKHRERREEKTIRVALEEEE